MMASRARKPNRPRAPKAEKEENGRGWRDGHTGEGDNVLAVLGDGVDPNSTLGLFLERDCLLLLRLDRTQPEPNAT